MNQVTPWIAETLFTAIKIFHNTYGYLNTYGYNVALTVKSVLPFVEPPNPTLHSTILNSIYSTGSILVSLVIFIKMFFRRDLSPQEILQIELMIVYLGLFVLVIGARSALLKSGKEASDAVNLLIRNKFLCCKPQFKNIRLWLDAPGVLLFYCVLALMYLEFQYRLFSVFLSWMFF